MWSAAITYGVSIVYMCNRQKCICLGGHIRWPYWEPSRYKKSAFEKVDLRVRDPTPRACDSLPLTTHFDHFPCIDHVLYANNLHHALFRHILQHGDRSIGVVPLIDRDSILEQRLFGNIHFILYTLKIIVKYCDYFLD